MTFIKKSLSLNGHTPFHNIITNKQINDIEQYNNILALAHNQANNIIDNANLEANTIIDNANQNAQYILDTTNHECETKLQEMQVHTEQMLDTATHQVQDIIHNSEQRVKQEVWEHAQNLVNNLEQTHNNFYIHTEELIKSTLALIIKKLTTNLEVQDRMQVIVHQVFLKAKEIEYATLFFNPKDFEMLPSFHIPQNWKVEKDNMLEQGICRLVGAGGEWKTSIDIIERKMLEAIDYKEINTIEDIQSIDDVEQLEELTNLENIKEVVEEDVDNVTEMNPQLHKELLNNNEDEWTDITSYPEENIYEDANTNIDDDIDSHIKHS